MVINKVRKINFSERKNKFLNQVFFLQTCKISLLKYIVFGFNNCFIIVISFSKSNTVSNNGNSTKLLNLIFKSKGFQISVKKPSVLKIKSNKMELLQSQAPAERELLGNQPSGHQTLEFRFWTLDIRVGTWDIRVVTLDIRVGTLTCANHGDHATSN